jgi:serine/threonine-protein kinase HipA
MSAEHLAQMARQLGMQARFLAQQARDMACRVPAATSQSAREFAPTLKSARTLAERLERFVASTTKRLQLARITAGA